MNISKPEKNKRILLKGFSGIFVVGVLTFVGFKLYPIIHGPTITVSTLVNGGSVNDAMVRISGNAAFTQELVVNGKNLNLAPDGTFDEKLVLNPGYNVITLQGSDRFGKKNSTTYAVVLNEKTPPATLTMVTSTKTPDLP